MRPYVARPSPYCTWFPDARSNALSVLANTLPPSRQWGLDQPKHGSPRRPQVPSHHTSHSAIRLMRLHHPRFLGDRLGSRTDTHGRKEERSADKYRTEKQTETQRAQISLLAPCFIFGLFYCPGVFVSFWKSRSGEEEALSWERWRTEKRVLHRGRREEGGGGEREMSISVV